MATQHLHLVGPGQDVPVERLAYPLREAAEAVGLGLTTFRQLIAAGELRTVKVGKRVLVPRREIERFLDRRLGTDEAS